MPLVWNGLRACPRASFAPIAIALPLASAQAHVSVLYAFEGGVPEGRGAVFDLRPGTGGANGTTGLTTTQLQSGLPSGFDPKVWAQDGKINHGFPYLIANPPPH